MSGWDALQRESLRAMGLSLYQHVATGKDAPAQLSPALHAALARAARCQPQELFPITVAMAVHTAQGKRALWPRLRAMRRSR